MKAYKIFKKTKSGVYRPAQVPIRSLSVKGYQKGIWYEAEDAQPTNLKNRVGFHATTKPTVPHIKIIPDQVVWLEVEIEDFETIQRPESQGGTWYLARYLKIIKELTEEDRLQLITDEEYNREMK